MTVNLKHPDGLAIVHKLVQESDVLVENYIPGKLASMGLGYDDCRKLNPRLIYASITGRSCIYCHAMVPDARQATDRQVRIARPLGTTSSSKAKLGLCTCESWSRNCDVDTQNGL